MGLGDHYFVFPTHEDPYFSPYSHRRVKDPGSQEPVFINALSATCCFGPEPCLIAQPSYLGADKCLYIAVCC